ncbi:MAG TPA: arsenite efflux transporter metallochaperone ArsD [Candidatus Gastranaerophilales bacterium]|nr:arsenite efflux transporter metallochaperone ArsD [Candidatus Gastranaerophilales bacterium]
MKKLQVFDPPMCCSSGVCGTNVDTKLVKFAGDLEWLKKQGIEVERYNLSSEPSTFVNNPVVQKTLKEEGNECLPLILMNNEIMFKGKYPDRKKLAEICGTEFNNEEAVSKETITSGSVCGPECDCHQSAVGDNTKKLIFAAVVIVIIGIIFFKLSNKASAAEFRYFNFWKKPAYQTIPVNISNELLGEQIDSLSQMSSNTDVAYVYIPAQNNQGISSSAKNAAISAQKILKNRNISAGLYTLKPATADYNKLVTQTAAPAILVIYKGQNTGFVTGEINQTRLLQAYIAATRAGDCGSGCPCH